MIIKEHLKCILFLNEDLKTKKTKWQIYKEENFREGEEEMSITELYLRRMEKTLDLFLLVLGNQKKAFKIQHIP